MSAENDSRPWLCRKTSFQVRGIAGEVGTSTWSCALWLLVLAGLLHAIEVYLSIVVPNSCDSRVGTFFLLDGCIGLSQCCVMYCLSWIAREIASVGKRHLISTCSEDGSDEEMHVRKDASQEYHAPSLKCCHGIVKTLLQVLSSFAQIYGISQVVHAGEHCGVFPIVAWAVIALQTSLIVADAVAIYS
eukprot:CAMPEP_0177225354 /NCGR_PEP_ID=MMETSP0367-20130122/39501_1 /TAXON_ID=447022 ORGANISM="Scrippsiella hangoei-like, Strain SHHI-4" /NCGR_SAMPLE_ID=MMETSP0367 /ASSEMBLY_ACC=CAM_ASM_000362 /LENGTH=187 /DNA_ID=CAMNT_0018675441 /DNA_START=48 /DNA_END=611 /DNA_ORIENTATION=+